MTLLELIEELPAYSRLNSAIMNDPEQAPLIVERLRAEEGQGDKAGKLKWSPDLAEWSLSHELLAEIRDVLAQANSEKKITVFPRPTTLVDEEKKRTAASNSEAEARNLVAQLTPWAVT